MGIVFTGGEGPEPEKLRRLISGLTGKTLFVAADSGLILAEAAGIKPDWIVGDMDSLDNPEQLHSYPGEKIIRHKPDKDYTDTELALALVWEKQCDEVWIIGGGGGRLDHLLAVRDLFEREQHPSRWITFDNDVHCISARTAGGAFTFTQKPGMPVSVFPAGTGPWEASSEGLKWQLKNAHWERGFYGLGLSNTAVTGDFSITVNKGRFMVILTQQQEKNNVSGHH